MALIINLHGPNTNTLGNLIAGALTEMGYSASAVPSCRRKMELEAMRGDDQAIPSHERLARKLHRACSHAGRTSTSAPLTLNRMP